MLDLKSTRAEATDALERYYYTGKPCKNGHLSKRETITGACMECRKIARQAEAARRKQLTEAMNAANGG